MNTGSYMTSAPTARISNQVIGPDGLSMFILQPLGGFCHQSRTSSKQSPSRDSVETTSTAQSHQRTSTSTTTQRSAPTYCN